MLPNKNAFFVWAADPEIQMQHQIFPVKVRICSLHFDDEVNQNIVYIGYEILSKKKSEILSKTSNG